MNNAKLACFSELWTTGEYLLLSTDGTNNLDKCVIFNQVEWTLRLIEDDTLDLAIKQEMLKQGVSVVIHFDEPNPWLAVVDELFARGESLEEINRQRRAFIELRRTQFRTAQQKAIHPE